MKSYLLPYDHGSVQAVANRRRLINLGSGWILVHAKSPVDVRLDQEYLRRLTDAGTLKLYHLHGPALAFSYWVKGPGCCGCGDAPPGDVVGRSVFMAKARGKHVAGFKDWRPTWK